MGNKTVDLSKLKEEIKSRKESGRNQSAVLDENTNQNEVKIQPKDNFLNNLMMSLDSGSENDASRVVKLIENKAAVKDGEERNLDNIDQPIKKPSTKQTNGENGRLNEELFADNSREEKLYNDMLRKQKTRLAEGHQYTTNNNNNYQKPVNENNTEQIFERVFDKMSEQFDSKIIEMYSYERIKNVLYENKDLIKTLVVEVIKELREKNKK